MDVINSGLARSVRGNHEEKILQSSVKDTGEREVMERSVP